VYYVSQRHIEVYDKKFYRSEIQLNNFCHASSENLVHPAYSPDLAPSSYRLLPAPKARLNSHKFSSNDDVKIALIQ
jgi:hypothetical protein